jgi:hypothetical protein
MSKRLIITLALAIVLISGAYAGAQAQCGCFHMPSCLSCNAQAYQADRDFDRPDQTCQGALRYGPTVPEYFGAVGVGGG